MKLWPFENGAVCVVLAGAVVYFRLPLDWPTLGWALGALAVHTARSHAGRLREDSGRGEDWTATLANWAALLGAVLAAQASQRVLLGVPLLVWVVHTAGRTIYRRARPAHRASWARDDD